MNTTVEKPLEERLSNVSLLEERLLDEGETAKLLKATKPCLRRWRHEKRGLPFVRVGRLVRYRLSDVRSFISSNIQEVSQGAGNEL